MAKLLGSFTHHDDSVKHSWRAFVESDADALEAALSDDFGLVLREPAADLLARARKAGRDGATGRAVDQGYEDDEDLQDEAVFVWCFEEYGKTNFGVGRGTTVDDTDKRENCWIHVEEWTPDPAKVVELESLSKEELVQRLLEVEATR